MINCTQNKYSHISKTSKKNKMKRSKKFERESEICKWKKEKETKKSAECNIK